jgi:DNA-3-methyladenine glycosylase I
MKNRCTWCLSEEIYIQYHDEEWGVPIHDDQMLFEMLCLEGAQAGLSWITVLKKRAHYRKVFDNFDAKKIAKYSEAKRAKLLADPGIIRNKLKVNAFIVNAQLYLDTQKEFGTFDKYIWQFVNHKPITNKHTNLSTVPAATPESEAMSKDLKKRGFKFVGATICYAFMQACGMVNDHTTDCFRHKEIKGRKK